MLFRQGVLDRGLKFSLSIAEGSPVSRVLALAGLREPLAAELSVEARRVAAQTRAETDRVQSVHEAEMSAATKNHRDELASARKRHDADTVIAQRVHEGGMRNMDLALASRDIFGQAKGIIMATMHCNPDTAFELIKKQSQAENRKALDVAQEIVARVERRAAPRRAIEVGRPVYPRLQFRNRSTRRPHRASGLRELVWRSTREPQGGPMSRRPSDSMGLTQTSDHQGDRSMRACTNSSPGAAAVGSIEPHQ